MIAHHQRNPQGHQISIERLFSEIREHIPEGLDVRVVLSPRWSRGILSRLRNLIHARGESGEVNHIVGDVHYLAFGLPRNRLVLTIHDCAILNRLSGWKLKLLRYFWFVGPMRRAAIVTTISEVTKNELQKWVGSLADKVVVIPNCVRSEFTPDAKPFNKGNPVVLQVGTGWNKNVERVAESLQGTTCRLEIVGTLSEEQRATIMATEVPFCELGRLSDEELVTAYRRCDFL
ncbi:glycosyltransferase, partial [Akkermansiaceae bacterium]|nr:glycosyltransferase [Akkermansiaceae bacterium]